MTSAHRYPPPPPNSQSDFRLPSLKDLNFYRPSGPQPPNPPSHQQDLAAVQPDSVQQPARHPAAWSRQTYHPPQQPAHQQYAPANHEVSPKVEYAPKHENSAYAHPAVPPSAHPNSAAMPPPQRSEDASHTPNQTKRHRTAPSAASRDTRPSHPSVYSHPQYPPPYPQPSQPPSASQYQSLPQGPPPAPSHAPHPASSSHDHRQQSLHSMPVTAHPAYAYPAYVQPRQTLLHPNSTQVSHHNQSTPYPSSAPPAHAPPPQPPWPQSQQPPSQFQQQPPPTQQHPHQGHAPSHHHHQQQQHQPQPSMPASSNQPIPSHHHHQQPPPPPPPPPTSAPSTNPPPSQQIPPSVQYHPQHQQYQNHYPHPSQQPQPQTPASFVRPTAVNPTTLENRSTYEPPRVPSVQNDAMSEITAHCNILYSFANQYVSLQHTNPHAQPPPAELEEMSQRALKVVRLLDDFRRICIPEGTQMLLSPTGSTLVSNSVPPLPADSPEPGESSRPPKRPWEDTQEEGVPASDSVGTQEQFPANPSPDPKTQTTAEQDMELIRTKRATSTAIANGSSGQPKSKYRKRSMGQRASPPGKCHSCNIRETPEWRRGPDGARTLCNACGLHYAKLMRKQNKAAGTGDAQHIDLETLRASTRAADAGEKGRNPSKQTESSSSSSKTNNKNQQNSSDTNPEASTSGRPGTTPPTPSQTAHQGSFQLVAVMAPPQDHHPVHPNHAPIPSSSSTAPTPMQVDSRPASQHASTPQMQTMHPPPPPSAPSHHSQPHPQHPPHPPWPTTAATTGAAAAASGAVSGTPAGSMRGGTAGGGGSASGSSAPSFGNPPSQSPVDFMRRQYSIPNRTGNQQQHQPANR